MSSPNFKTFIKQSNGEYRYQDYQTVHCIYGDTDSVYMNLEPFFERGADQDEVAAFSDSIGKDVNGSFESFMKDVFNSTPEQASVVQTDRETVSDKSFFTTKKRYIMHVVDSEGKRVDKNKIMGLEIKKSDTPKIVQDFLLELCEMIMNKASFNELKDYIKEFKVQYHKESLQSIGRPMSVKVFKEYEDIYKETNSMKGFAYHVRSALFYNSMCESKHMKVRSGDKVSICYVNHPDSKYVGVPVDANPDQIPDEVKNLMVNWDTQWATVEKKIENYFKPIGLDKANRQEKLVKQFITF